jgi:hypothetical protein
LLNWEKNSSLRANMKAWRRFLSLLLILPFLFAGSHSQEELYKDGSLERAEIIKQGFGLKLK